MMYYQWVVAALGVIVIYMVAAYVWAWWTKHRDNWHDRPLGQSARHRAFSPANIPGTH